MKNTSIITIGLGLLVSVSALTSDDVSTIKNQNINKHYASAYQAICNQPLETLTFATTQEAAPQLEKTLNATNTLGLRVANSESTTVYQQLAVTEWNQKFVVATNGNYKINIKGADATITDVANLQCQDRNLTMHHFNTHEWGSYLLQIDIDSGKPLELVIHPTAN
ncbi:hypothetical protein [Vibrio scophthalmi]|uniref:Lipoprotein n=1 Tax=Vibrio scophthalmi LMG 19158 TaxID=870967 RepID=F9RIY1_9VIBR|nr:hypothetical protein [Vibrio scophthalmi]EGU41743.1 hypothetical protein VIS19158_11124 [Vibrio scophthalmi LMG 19158]